MRDSKRLLSIFRSLSETRQQALLEYAEFLAGTLEGRPHPLAARAQRWMDAHRPPDVELAV